MRSDYNVFKNRALVSGETDILSNKLDLFADYSTKQFTLGGDVGDEEFS